MNCAKTHLCSIFNLVQLCNPINDLADTFACSVICSAESLHSTQYIGVWSLEIGFGMKLDAVQHLHEQDIYKSFSNKITFFFWTNSEIVLKLQKVFLIATFINSEKSARS